MSRVQIPSGSFLASLVIEDVSGEVDATLQVIKEHYDKPDEDKRRRARDEELRGIDWYGFD